MKRILIIFLLGILSSLSFAAKSYVFVKQRTGDGCALWGEIPNGMKDYYYNVHIGDILNELGHQGYILDKFEVTSASESYSSSNPSRLEIEYEYVAILSKDAEDASNGDNNVSTGTSGRRASSDEPTEIARYNLQGLPITGNEQGVQIIVYSDYTTKTILKE